MKTISRLLPLMTLATLLALPAGALAVDRDRSESRRGGDSTHRRDDDGDRARRGDRDRSTTRRGDSRRSDSDSDARRGRGWGGSGGGDSDSDSRWRRGDRSDSRRGESYRSATRRGRDYRSDSRRGRGSGRSYGHSHRYDTHYRYGRTRTVVVNPAPRVVVTPPRVVVRTDRRYIEPMYMSRGDFERVMWELQDARFEDERMDIIIRVARAFTVNSLQARAMAAELRFSSNRVDALATLYPRVRDRDNWYQVYDLLTFSSDRRDLRRRCGY